MLNKWVYILIFVLSISQSVLSQDKQVINPLSKAEIALLDFITNDSINNLVLNLQKEDFRFGVSNRLSNGSSFIKRKGVQFIQVKGTGRIYEVVKHHPSTYQFIRKDSTLHTGSNFGTLNWIYKDTIFQFGGTGFWKLRDFFSFFSSKTNEWEIYNTENSIPFSLNDKNNVLYFMDENAGKFYLSNSIAQQDFPKTLTLVDIDSTIVFDFAKRKWETLGALNPKLKALIKKQECQITHFGSYLIFHSDLELYWINFSTNSYGTFTTNKQAEFREKYLKLYNNSRDYEIQFVLGSNYYLIKITKEGKLSYETISLSLKDINEAAGSTIYDNDRFVQLMKELEPGKPIIGNVFIVLMVMLLYSLYNKKIKRKQTPIEVQSILYKNFYSALTAVEKELIQAIYELQIKQEQISIKAINKIIGVQQKDTITQNKSRSDYFLRINQKFKLATRANELLIVKQREETDKRIYNYNINNLFIVEIKSLILNNQ